ncbi:c-type cytochrome [Aquabacterium sp.]|uniref:c-type cytochrome n=1 Tax=Aquabacterium sp. TaxID=1872578 RepID=UPI002C570589|nr:c-type cytochrome [Aquabacterium sp.]HSW04593.1 c-type cytochrome [Aquabacterium sp.]
MSSCRDVRALALGLMLALAGPAVWAQTAYPGIGRAATAKEVAAWNIDVRPDFTGLPAGSGSVAQGQVVWEGQCASCHGVFGESNAVFSPLVGGTTADDVTRGRVARLNDAGFPGRTMLMKLSSVSTLWDYIHRAMPWNQPKSLSVTEVYAVTAYLLNLGGVLPDNFVLSNTNIAEVQQRLPNRKGMSTDHGLWPGKGLGNGGKPDVRATACMRNCVTQTAVASFLPEYARNSHGNLAEQQRGVGAQRGADTTRPAGAPQRPGDPPSPGAPATAVADNAAALTLALAQKHACTACHGTDSRIVGPGFRQIAAKYAGRQDADAYLLGRIRSGGQGVWGAIPMPAQTLPEADAQAIAQWLAAGAKQ